MVSIATSVVQMSFLQIFWKEAEDKRIYLYAILKVNIAWDPD